MTSNIDGITVIIAAYNAEATIWRAMRSALAQKEVAEVLVVDDASTDRTVDVAMYYRNVSSKIRVIVKTKNHGPAMARNMGISLCRTPFLAILDADDEFLPNRFANLQDGDWDFLSDNMIFIPGGVDEDVKSLMPADQPCLERQLTLEEFLVSNTDGTDSKGIELGFMKPIVRCSAIKRFELTYDENLRLGEDYLFYAQALARGARMQLSNCYGYVAHVSSTSLSRCHRTQDLEALMKADQHLLDELAAGNAPGRSVELVRQHQAHIARKIVNREFLDEKKRFGALRAITSQVRRPRQFARIVADILHDRTRHQDVTTHPRSLFDQGEFVERAQFARCS